MPYLFPLIKLKWNAGTNKVNKDRRLMPAQCVQMHVQTDAREV